MNIHLIAVGEKMPRWVQEGFGEYAKRLPAECALKLVEIAPGKRGKNADIARAMRDEGERMLAAIPNAGPFLEFSIEPSGFGGLYAPLPEVRNGVVAVPAGPGWGVTIDASWLAAAEHHVPTTSRPVNSTARYITFRFDIASSSLEFAFRFRTQDVVLIK